ncbi:MAG: class I SAM-dependent methyltransferase [Nanobdellota archaeon]
MVDLKDKRRNHYDRLVGASRDFNKQIEWFDGLFKRYNVKSVLDCGCGTGTHAVLLAKKGYNVTAFDSSEEQIKLARKKAKENNVRIRFYVGDIRNFNFGKFDASISLYAPIMFGCKNIKDLTKSIKAIKNSLNPKGIAFIETLTSKMLESSGLEINEYAEDKFKIARLTFYNFNKPKKSARVKYVYVSHKNNKTSYEEAEANHYYYDKKDFEAAFQKTGAKPIRWYSGFNNKKGGYELFKEDSSGMISPLFR